MVRVTSTGSSLNSAVFSELSLCTNDQIWTELFYKLDVSTHDHGLC